MAGFLYKGILLQQKKEPALSRDLREFFNADTMGAVIDRKPTDNMDELTHDDILVIARQARIVDERDGKLLANKLAASRRYKPQILIADAIDDEPYISSQLNPMLHNQQLCAQGLRLAQRVCGSKEAYFAVYRNLTDLEVKIPKSIEEFPVQRIGGRYPAEYQASKAFSANASTLIIGACALIHLARAVLYNKPQTTAFITVAGDCVGNPTNLEVSLGMTVAQTLERCGLIYDPARVIVGGSMTGISVIDTENTVVTPVTRGILAFRDKANDQEDQCIGCSRCVHACPEGLNPYLLYRSARLHRYKEFRRLDAHMCVQCNTCSYMCPAKLDLCNTIKQCAHEFRKMSGSMRSASVERKKREKQEFDDYMNEYYARKAEKAAKKTKRREEKSAMHADTLDPSTTETEKELVQAAVSAQPDSKPASSAAPTAQVQDAEPSVKLEQTETAAAEKDPLCGWHKNTSDTNGEDTI